MAESKKTEAKPKPKPSAKVFRLNEQTGSFYDPETGMTITRSESVKIDKSSAGVKTLAAIHAGGLIEVGTEPQEEGTQSEDESL